MAPMHEAGGRLFVDATPHLATEAGRTAFLGMIGRADPLTLDALETVLARGRRAGDAGPGSGRPAGGRPPPPIETDPAIVTGLVARSRESVAALRRDIRGRSGPELFDFLIEAFTEHKRVLTDPVSAQVIMAGMQATWWLNDKLGEWLGERDAADTLTLSAPGNVTSEMGLALLDVADVIRPYPEVVAFLRDARRRRVPGRAAETAGRRAGARGRRGLPGPVRHALRRRDRHHPAAVERAPGHARAADPGQRPHLHPGRGRAPLRARPGTGRGEGPGGARPPARAARRRTQGRRDAAHDRPGTHVHRLPGVPEVRHREPLRRLQARAARGGRPAGAGRCARRPGGRLPPHVRRVPRGRRPPAGPTPG